jgi:hypothetical protein
MQITFSCTEYILSQCVFVFYANIYKENKDVSHFSMCVFTTCRSTRVLLFSTYMQLLQIFQINCIFMCEILSCKNYWENKSEFIEIFSEIPRGIKRTYVLDRF